MCKPLTIGWQNLPSTNAIGLAGFGVVLRGVVF